MGEVETKNEKIVRHFFDTLSSGDLEKLRLLLHENCIWGIMVTGIQGAGENTDARRSLTISSTQSAEKTAFSCMAIRRC